MDTELKAQIDANAELLKKKLKESLRKSVVFSKYRTAWADELPNTDTANFTKVSAEYEGYPFSHPLEPNEAEHLTSGLVRQVDAAFGREMESEGSVLAIDRNRDRAPGDLPGVAVRRIETEQCVAVHASAANKAGDATRCLHRLSIWAKVVKTSG